MITKTIFNSILFLGVLFLTININLFSQIDTTKTPKALTGIADTSMSSDSSITTTQIKPFLLSLKSNFKEGVISSFRLSTKQTDKLNYRTVGDILPQLPFSFLTDFGYLGAPNEPNIYGFGHGNISLIIDEKVLNNRWNNSSDLNWIQTEDIAEINITPLNRGFLYGFNTNPSTIYLKKIDSIKTKPISRIRYFQASYDEGFIDAMFSARVLSRLGLSFRVTNSSRESNYTNTAYGSWKANLKGIYKLDDSLFVNVSYDHLKLNTSLNGGISITPLLQNPSSINSNVFSTQSEVLFEDMKNVTSSNNVSSKIYGNIIPGGFTSIAFGYNQYEDIIRRSINSTEKIKVTNQYNIFNSNFQYELGSSNLTSIFSAGFEEIQFDIETISYNKNISNYYGSLQLDYSFLNKLIIPAIYGKYSKFNSQFNSGLGFDITINPSRSVKIFLGASNFDKPLSIIESYYLSNNTKQNYTTGFASLEYNSELLNTSISYFNTESSNTPVPIFNSPDISESTTEIIYTTTDNLKTSGFNINSKMELYNILATVNFNYYWQSENSLLSKEMKYNLAAGLYYVDTLYNSNLDLKTGFTFYLSDNQKYRIYDFQKMRSASYYLDNNDLRAFDFYSTDNNPFRIDFLLAGRIQDAATFYLIYENILGNNYYIIPYYPMPDGGMRIGISWDFLD